ncbi:MAG TPA: phosphoglycolate phosphatase, partial [Blastocatellia bacterium]|nr:phosphoglycolate phosphatase [Blastocatellia bacterium]
RLLEMRAKTGRPHWIVLDEVHHLIGENYDPALITIPQDVSGILMITVKPNHVASGALAIADTIVAIGEKPEETIKVFCEATGQAAPRLTPAKLEKGEALIWTRDENKAPVWMRSVPPSGVQRRHRRKYAEGELTTDRSFYFRGPEEKLNLRAQNLMIFVQLAEGVDDETWLYHLRNGEYERWFRDVIHDESLAEQAARVAKDESLSAQESRKRIRVAIERRYTATA